MKQTAPFYTLTYRKAGGMTKVMKNAIRDVV